MKTINQPQHVKSPSRDLDTKLHIPWPLPVTRLATNVGITAIAIHATATDCILFEIEDFRVRHPIKNRAQRAYLSAPGASQQFDRTSALFRGHVANIGKGTDINPAIKG
jgi:hypothetical protein